MDLSRALIRPYHKNDNAACMLAFNSNVPLFFTVPEITQFENWLAKFDASATAEPDFQSYYFVLLLDRAVIGCGGFVHHSVKNESTFSWGLVHRAYHKKGFGKLLFDYRLSKMKMMYPTASILLDTTQHSYTFFQKYGFVTEKYTKEGYGEGMHRYDMRLKE